PGDPPWHIQTRPRTSRAALLNRYSPPPPRFEPSSKMRTCLCHVRDESARPSRSRSLLAPDELECFLAGRDLARRAFFFDELEQPPDLRARWQVEFVVVEKRFSWIVLVCFLYCVVVLGGFDED